MAKLHMERKVTRSGGITLPKWLRNKLGLQAGDTLDIAMRDDGALILRRNHARCSACGFDEQVITYKQIALCKNCREEITRRVTL